MYFCWGSEGGGDGGGERGGVRIVVDMVIMVVGYWWFRSNSGGCYNPYKGSICNSYYPNKSTLKNNNCKTIRLRAVQPSPAYSSLFHSISLFTKSLESPQKVLNKSPGSPQKVVHQTCTSGSSTRWRCLTRGSSTCGPLKTRSCSKLDLWVVLAWSHKNKELFQIGLMDRPNMAGV